MFRPISVFAALALTMASGTASAEYTYSFPVTGTDNFSYGSEMTEGGDFVQGTRSTPDYPSINSLSINIEFDTSGLDCQFADVNFYFDDIYLGQAELTPLLFSTITVTDVVQFLPSEVLNSTTHTFRIELADDLDEFPICDDHLRIREANSYITMDLLEADNDGDGYYSQTYYGDDCNDQSSGINPGASEVCDSIDNDCDNTSDEGVGSIYYEDADADTYGDSNSTVTACSAPNGYAGRGGDCDDENGEISPSSNESCNFTDDDCDNTVDEGVTNTYYGDEDDDGYGSDDDTTTGCSEPDGYTDRGGDCNDEADDIYPNAPELCDNLDNNCNGSTDEGVRDTYYEDGDDDGYGNSNSLTACEQPEGYSTAGGDCNDSDDGIYPNAPEQCDGLDNNCNGSTDEGVSNTYYQDADDDNYGNSNSTQACSLPDGYTSTPGDCDDADADVYPNAPETCDSKDNNCNDSVDEGVTSTFYLDSDGDAYGTTLAIQACAQPSGYAPTTGDCDDSDDTVYPNAPELCDDKDNNCNITVDEGVKNIYYQDDDGDGVGVFAETTQACTVPNGYAATYGDCNDSDDTVYPQAGELCDEQDNDCDEAVDEGVLSIVYRDVDADTYGDPNDTLEQCDPPLGYVGRGGDCDDDDDTVYPSAEELCDSKDNDCDTDTDEGVQNTYYADNDDDTYGDNGDLVLACTAPDGYVGRGNDCDDDSGTTYPGAVETCNYADDDCDEETDEGVKTTYFEDVDGDDFGDTASTVDDCQLPDGYALVPGDCDDESETSYPEAPETCNVIDDDCDGGTDEGVQTTYYQDVDGDDFGISEVTTLACETPDGYADVIGDCDDNASTVNPDGTETCNETDDDCDDGIDEGVETEFYGDNDADGYGVPDTTTLACERPNGYADTSDDCNDNSATTYPGASESCNILDDDCDGNVDEDVETEFYADSDNDNYGDADQTFLGCEQPEGYVSNSLDCNDDDGETYPGADEVCNENDDNCNGDTDEGVESIFFLDADGDEFGNSGETTLACTAPDGFVDNDADCDDSVTSVNPDAEEVCDSVDQDCDELIDEGVLTTFYADTDADTFGDDGLTTESCTRQDGFSPTGGDCNDDEASINPLADEVCDGVDQDCDNSFDEGVTNTYYFDGDEDGYGTDEETEDACAVGNGYVDNNDDCDDDSADINPDGTEVCEDDIDQDCNGLDLSCSNADADSDGVSPVDGDCDDNDDTVYPEAPELCDEKDNDCNGKVDDRDVDGDGFVDATCADGTDCNDDDASINPDAEEICVDELGDLEGVDNDCSGEADDRDADDDGYIDAVCDGLDCDDDDPRLNPDQVEICDGLDNDCNGVEDDLDEDGDGYITQLCDGLDCNDADAEINPDSEELEDGVDNNCNGAIDEGSEAFDDDGDGYTEDGGDCNDADASINPGQIEVLDDGIDNNCNGEVDEFEATPTPDLHTPSPTEDGYTPSETEATPTEGDYTGSETEVTPTEGDYTGSETEVTPTEEVTDVATATVAPTDVPVTSTPAVSPTPADSTNYPSPTIGGGGGSEGCECSSGGDAGSAAGHLLMLFLAFAGKGLMRRRES